MAHGLIEGSTMVSGMNEVPWHGLGKVVPGRMTTIEALDLAELADWDVQKQEIFLADGTKIPDRWATVRMKDMHPLGVVGKDYRVIQNEQMFSFIDDLTNDTSGGKWETAGSLWGGRKIWGLVKVPFIATIGGDSVDNYLLVTGSHDGSTAFTVAWTPVRVVCQNTLTAALGQTSGRMYRRHVGEMTGLVGDAREVLGIIEQQCLSMAAVAEQLGNWNPTETQVTQVLDKLWGDESHPKAKERVRELAQCGAGQDPTNPINGWGLYNGITEYVDHHTPLRDMGDNNKYAADRRFERVLTGPGKKLKDDAAVIIRQISGIEGTNGV